MAEESYIEVEDFEYDFAQVPKAALRDKNISLKAKGLYAYLFALPKGWRVYRTALLKELSDGKDSLNSAFKELENFGYIVSTPIRENGQFKGYKLKLLRKSMFDTDTVSPLRKNRSGKTGDGKTGSGKSASNNIDSNNIDLKDTLSEDKEAVPSDLFNGFGVIPKEKKKFVKPSAEEIQTFFSELNFANLAAEFHDHYKSNGWVVGRTKMVDWHAAARNWVARHVAKLELLQQATNSPKGIKSFVDKHKDA